MQCVACDKEFDKQVHNSKYCSNSCRVRTHNATYRAKLLVSVAKRKEQGCSKCSEKRPWCLHFHHLDPSKKLGNINRMIKSVTLKQLEEEMDKCIVLCANCHADEEHQQGR
jgi:hypothetical protein